MSRCGQETWRRSAFAGPATGPDRRYHKTGLRAGPGFPGVRWDGPRPRSRLARIATVKDAKPFGSSSLASLLILAGLLFWPVQRAFPSPSPPSDRLGEARTALARGDLSQARSILESLLEQEPENAGALILLGRTLVESNRPGEAIGPLESALQRTPDSGEALLWMWRAKRKTGPPEESDPYFFRALKVEATDPVLYELAEEAYGRGLYQEAIQALRRIQEPNRLDQPHATLLAACLHARGDVQGALDILGEAVERDSNGQTHFSLGYYLFKAGRFAAAEKHLRRSLDLAPDSANSRFFLAKISESDGYLGGRKSSIARSLRCAPTMPEHLRRWAAWL